MAETTRLRTRPATGRASRTPFRVGAWCWIVTGSGHLLGDAYLRRFPAEADRSIDAAMRAHPFEVLGLQRSLYEVTMGFSLAMGTCMVFVGVLLLYIERLATPRSARSAAALGLAMSSLALAICAWLEPPPPIVLFSLAVAGFGLSLRNAGLSRGGGTVR